MMPNMMPEPVNYTAGVIEEVASRLASLMQNLVNENEAMTRQINACRDTIDRNNEAITQAEAALIALGQPTKIRPTTVSGGNIPSDWDLRVDSARADQTGAMAYYG